MFIGDKCCGGTQRGNDDKATRREEGGYNSKCDSPLTCPLSKDLKEGRKAPHAYLGFQAEVSSAKVPHVCGGQGG